MSKIIIATNPGLSIIQYKTGSKERVETITVINEALLVPFHDLENILECFDLARDHESALMIEPKLLLGFLQ